MARLKGLAKAAARVEEKRLPNLAGAHFISIDPGKTYFGWAEFQFSVLLRCGYAPDLDDVKALAARVPECVVEKPRVYAHKRIDQNDIVELAFSAGVLAGAFEHRSTVSPQQWKGTIDGAIMCERIRELVANRDAAQRILRVLPSGKHEHVLDAIGIGFRCCGVQL